MAKRPKKWVQRAIKRPGRMTNYCKRQGYTGATCECLRKAARSKNKSLASAARLGLRLKGCSGSKPLGRRKKRK